MLPNHGLRREEAVKVIISNIQERRGIRHLLIHGKGRKLRNLPLHPMASERMEMSDHHLVDGKAQLFVPLRAG
ncbi:hypothetical protein PHLH7_08350 [Pseudomonas sp. Ost2]|nr:hypothetical protein PHLH7_08350 [Pseudomonas sp. Ost2]